MIVTRTPFRVTLGGGGTDLPSYYSKYGGFIFSAGIDKYMVISVNRPVIDDLIRLKYSQVEIVPNREELKHDIAKEALRILGIERGVEINSIADISAGTGLGSSSCYAVGLLHALHVFKREYVSLERLAEEDFHLETELLHRPIGKQDPYLAALGGLTVLEISPDGKTQIRAARASEETIDDLNRNMLIFFTGVTRNADTILSEQSSSVKEEKKDVVESMHYIKELGYKILAAVESGNITEVGRAFDTHWQYKKKISAKMTNPEFDRIYEVAKKNGALGGKISGAGGGGFFTFYTEDKHKQLREAMFKEGLREMRYRFDFEGSKVMVDF